jgi:hypothetical protein
MDFDVELERIKDEMNDAEDTLLDLGFPEDQWHLIRKYITSAILHNQITAAKARLE